MSSLDLQWQTLKSLLDCRVSLDILLIALAQHKRGAIVVFPGKESVKAWISEGISLDARVSFPQNGK